MAKFEITLSEDFLKLLREQGTTISSGGKVYSHLPQWFGVEGKKYYIYMTDELPTWAFEMVRDMGQCLPEYKLNITDRILDLLGFTEYWDEDGDWGGRTLTFKNDRFRIAEYEETDDEDQGYSTKPKYRAHHWTFSGFFALPKVIGNESHDLFFLHDMHECLKKYYPDSVEEFVEKCKSLHMQDYLYLKKD